MSIGTHLGQQRFFSNTPVYPFLLLQYFTIVAHERTFLTRVDTVYNASDAGIDIKRRHLDGPRSGPDNSSPVTARTPFNAVSSSGGLARSQNFLYSILHSPIDKRHPSPVEITISKQAPVRIPTVQYSHPVTCKVSCAVAPDLF